MDQKGKQYYHVSEIKLSVGYKLEGTGKFFVAPEVETILMECMPADGISRDACVFLGESPEMSRHGLPYDFGYLHYVLPEGEPQRRDNSWIGELQRRLHKNPKIRARANITLAAISNNEIAAKYWAGEPSSEPNFELVARSAIVLGLAQEDPIPIRSHDIIRWDQMLAGNKPTLSPEKGSDENDQ